MRVATITMDKSRESTILARQKIPARLRPMTKTTYSVFDIAGPIMVGPSSSHTAGAVKLGQLAQAIFDTTPDRVVFQLHGSFATVTKGHATDRALLAGVMKMKTSDPRIKDAFKEAKKAKLSYDYETVDLGPKFHPNSVRVLLEKKDAKTGVVKKMSVTGSSIGGGNVMICQVNDVDVDIRAIAGKYKSIIVSHSAKKQPLEELRAYLEKQRHHIASIQTTNFQTMSIINIDRKHLTLREVQALEMIPGIEFVRSLTRLAH